MTGPTTTVDPTVSSLEIQAQELAGEITSDGQTLDQLAAAYQSAQLRYRALSAQQEAGRRAVAATAAQVSAARQALKQQAILSYVAGGGPVISQMPDRPGTDRSLVIAYAEIVAGGQKRAVQNYRATLDTQTRVQAQFDATTRQMGLTLRSIRSDSSQAAGTMNAQQQALSQVKGQLAVAVARVEAQQQAAEAAQEQATLTAQGIQLPQSSRSTATSAPPPTGAATIAALPGAVASTTAAPTTAASHVPSTTRAPSTTAPASTRAPVTTPPATTPPATNAPTTAGTGATGSAGGSGGSAVQAPGVSQVLAYARAQLGKPYQWAGAGPDSFDCSGLVMMAWEQAQIYFPHLAQDQYDLTARIPLSSLIPGDLVFFGTPNNVYHVGIYVGSGDMIDAPETGQNVQVQSIYWDTLLGAGRVTASS